MPLDPSIPLQFRGVDPNAISNTIAQILQQNRYRAQDRRLAQKDAESQTRRNALSAYISGDQSDESLRTYGAQDPEGYFAVIKDKREADKSLANTEKLKAQGQLSQIEGALGKIKLGGEILRSVTDEPSYQQARGVANQNNLDTRQWPNMYDPQWVAQGVQRTMSVQNQMEMKLKEMNVESEISNRQAMLGVAQGHLGVSQGQLAVAQSNAADMARHRQFEEGHPSSGMSITGYDEQGRPLVQMGGRPAPNLTEGQMRATGNMAAAKFSNSELEDLKRQGFDPASLSGAANTWMAGIPMANVVASEEGQRQHAANVGFALAVNYQRSGASTPEKEYNLAIDSMIDRLGDKDETKIYKAQIRAALVDAITAGGGPRVDQIIQQAIGSRRPAGAAGRTGQIMSAPTDVVPGDPAAHGQSPRGRSFSTPPVASQQSGKWMTTKDGTVYRSDGSNWIRQ